MWLSFILDRTIRDLGATFSWWCGRCGVVLALCIYPCYYFCNFWTRKSLLLCVCFVNSNPQCHLCEKILHQIFSHTCFWVPEKAVSFISWGLSLESSENFFGPERPVVKLQSAFFEKLIFLVVFNVRKTKRIAKFDGLEPRRREDIKGIVSPAIGRKTFGTFEKQAPGPDICISWKTEKTLWHLNGTHLSKDKLLLRVERLVIKIWSLEE